MYKNSKDIALKELIVLNAEFDDNQAEFLKEIKFMRFVYSFY